MTQLFLPMTNATEKTTRQTIADLKQHGCDFEWYPTTEEMVAAWTDDLKKADGSIYNLSYLEIGFGDGRVCKQISTMNGHNRHDREMDLFGKLRGIEKAEVHLNNKPSNIIFCGADFKQVNISNIKTDVLFCNPPYSEYELWTQRIIDDGFFGVAYIVIPERWVNSKLIEQALERRNMVADCIFTGDFMQADRQARAKINIVRIISQKQTIKSLIEARYKRHGIGPSEENIEKIKTFSFSLESYRTADDPFNTWFNTHFSNLKQTGPSCTEWESRKIKAEKVGELFVTHNHIDDLVGFYNKDMQVLHNNFIKLNEVDRELFSLLKVDIESICDILKERARQIRLDYWHNFINFYKPIRERLTSKAQDDLAKRLLDSADGLDFNRDNCFAVTLLVIKEANKMSSEMLEWFFDEMAKSGNITAYKSNKKVFGKSDWRYLKDEFTHFQLDYRIIQQSLFNVSSYRGFDADKGARAINDILAIANILGFSKALSLDGRTIINQYGPAFGKKFIASVEDPKTNKDMVLFDIKFYQNGNQHIRLNQKLVKRLNIVMSKIKGWVHSFDEMVEELNINKSDIKEARDYYDNTEAKIAIVNNSMLPALGFHNNDAA